MSAPIKGSRRFLDRLTGHYGLMLAALLVMLAAVPFTHIYPWVDFVVVAALMLVVATSILCMRKRRRFVKVATVLGTLALFFGFDERIGMIMPFWPAENLFKLGFLLLLIFGIADDMLRHREASLNTIFGAASIYLLMSLSWASIYSIIEWLEPGSFSLESDSPVGQVMGQHAQLLYFSLITLTTVGYGDITPLSPQARFLATLEGVIGQLFIAIVIGRLVGLEISNRMRGKRS